MGTTRHRRVVCRAAAMMLLWGLVLDAAAGEPGHHCATVAEAAKRLACYDEAFPPPREVLEAATQQVRADFGLNRPADGLRNPGQTAEQADPDRIESRVVRVDHGGGGQRSFHLENGQVWTQTESRSIGHVRADDLVQVRKAVMGGFHLVMPNGVVVRVRRTR